MTATAPQDASTDFPYGIGTSTGPDAPIEYTKYDVASALAVLARTEDAAEPQRITALTDEQLVGLDGYLRRQVVALPWLADHTEEMPVLAAAGLRSLLASGALAMGADTETGEQRWLATPDLDGCLVLRRTADVLCSAERQVEGPDGGQVHRLYYYAHAEGVLEEEVTSSGMHVFSALRPEAVPARMLRLIDQDEVASEATDPVALRLSELGPQSPLAEQLADTRALTVVTAMDTASDATKQMTIYATTSAVFVMEVDPEDETEDPLVRVRAVTREELEGLAAWLLVRES